MSNFWRTNLGISIRWLLYIPVGYCILKAAGVLVMLFVSLLFKNAYTFFLVGIIAGGLALLPATAYLFSFLSKKIIEICPSPKTGMLVFSAIYVLDSIYTITTNIGHGYVGFAGWWHLALRCAVSFLACLMLLIAVSKVRANARRSEQQFS